MPPSFQEPAMPDASRVARSFAEDVRALGEAGVADWLVRSFAGPEPQHVMGWFHSDDDALFGEVFRRVVPQFTEETRITAARGVERALERFDAAAGTLYGLLEFAYAVEAVKGVHLLPRVAAILDAWFDPRSGAFRRPLAAAEDVVALRDALECAFRLLPPMRADLPEGGGGFADLGRWAHHLLVGRPHASRALVPAYAPLYMLSLVHDAPPNERLRAEVVIRGGWRTVDDPFPDFYAFHSKAAPGSAYPYDLDRLLALGEHFVTDEPIFFVMTGGVDLSADPGWVTATGGQKPVTVTAAYADAYEAELAA